MKGSLVLSLVTLCVLSTFTQAQKRLPAKTTTAEQTQQAAPSYRDGQIVQQTICKGLPIPTGYVPAGETSTSDCRGGAWILKRRGTRLRPDVSATAARSRTIDEDEEDSENNPSRTSVRAKDVATTSTMRPVPERPSNTEVDDAVRQQRVLIGMTFQDVYRAWNPPRNKGIGVSEYGRVEIWYYRNAKVYFAQGRVVEVIVVQ